MIKNDYPVIFSVATPYKNLTLYDSLELAKNKKSNKAINHHYMTVIGLYKIYNKELGKYELFLRVTDRGSIRYVRYDEYSKLLGVVSNILVIGE